MEETWTRTREESTICVHAPIEEVELGIQFESLHAVADPADEDQAVLVNVPFFIEWLNFGDIVRLGPANENGCRQITEVVVASGHSRVMAFTGDHDSSGLTGLLEDRFPNYALRIEGDGNCILSISIHPHFNPLDVQRLVEAWLFAEGAIEDEDVAVSPVLGSQVGPVKWPEGQL